MQIHWQDHITADPKIMFGKPVIRGTRIPVELILEKMANLYRRTPFGAEQATFDANRTGFGCTCPDFATH